MATLEQKREFYKKVQEQIATFIATEKSKVANQLGSKGYIHENAAPLFGEDSYENQFDYNAAAKLVFFETVKLPKEIEEGKEVDNATKEANALAEKHDYDFDAWAEDFQTKANETCKNLANDAYFQCYARDFLMKKGASLREDATADFANGYIEYTKKVEKAADVWDSPIVASDEMSSKSTIQTMLKSKLRNLNDSMFIDQEVKPDKNVANAVNMVICKTLLTKAADAMFYVGITHTVENEYNMRDPMNPIKVTKYSDNQIAERCEQMKKEIINDPLFRETIATDNIKLKDVYDTYMKKVNFDINKKINAEKSRTRDLQSDPATWEKFTTFAKNKKGVYTTKQLESIQSVYNNLTNLNEGKEPTTAMKNLMNALEKVVGGDKSATALNTLNKAALNYYNDRQGIFFSPFTDLGKGRLREVGKLVRITEPLMKDVTKEFEKEQRAPELNNKKNIAMGMN